MKTKDIDTNSSEENLNDSATVRACINDVRKIKIGKSKIKINV